MSSAQFPDGHFEEVRNAQLSEIFARAEDALKRGAEKVTIYAEPHPFDGAVRRCLTCGCPADDEVHNPIELREKKGAHEARMREAAWKPRGTGGWAKSRRSSRQRKNS